MTVDNYFKSIPEKVQFLLNQIRSVIRENAPDKVVAAQFKNRSGDKSYDWMDDREKN